MMTLRQALLAVGVAALLLAGVARAGPAEDVQALWLQGAEHFQQGRSEQAVEALERALDLARRALGEERPETAASCEYLGLVLLDRREVERARDCLERSVGICRQALGASHFQTGSALLGLARTRDAAGDDPGAEEAYAEAERILRASPGAEKRLGEALQRHGKRALRLGRWATAVSLLQESREVLAATWGAGSPQARAVDLPLATALVRAGRHAEAERACREALDAQPGAASFLALRGEALFYLGRYAEARSDYEALLASASAADTLRAGALAGLSRVAFLEGDAEGARRLAEEALDLRLRALGPTHLEVANSYNDLCALATQQLDFERALACANGRWRSRPGTTGRATR